MTPSRTIARPAQALAWALTAWLACLPAQADDDAQTPTQARADRLVALHAQGFKDTLGVHAIDLRTGETLLAHRQADPRIPASVQKLLTSAVALERLGGEFRFETRLLRLGDDLVVDGQCDPTLGDPLLAERNDANVYAVLDAWARAAGKDPRQATARDLVLRQRRDLETYRHPDWPDAQKRRWYCAPVAALNFHDNCLDVTFAKGRSKPVPVLAPQSRYLRLTDRTRRGKRHVWWARLAESDGVVTIGGTVASASGSPYPVAVDYPPLLLGRVLADRLARAGVQVEGSLCLKRLSDDALEDARTLASHRTGLPEVLARANKRSLNLAAECLLLRAGDYTWQGSARQAKRTLVKTFGLSERDLIVADGSGLSRRNRVTAQAITRLLTGLANRDDGALVLRSLPIAGVDGSLRRRLRDRRYRGRIAAKTGTLAGVSCLAGYVLDRAGKEGEPVIAFAVLCNDLSGRQRSAADQLENALAILLVDHVDAESRR